MQTDRRRSSFGAWLLLGAIVLGGMYVLARWLSGRPPSRYNSFLTAEAKGLYDYQEPTSAPEPDYDEYIEYSNKDEVDEEAVRQAEEAVDRAISSTLQAEQEEMREARNADATLVRSYESTAGAEQINPSGAITHGSLSDASRTPRAVRGDCAAWDRAAEYVGSYTCIWGVVTSTHQADSAFFINFADDWRTGFYGVSFDHAFPGLEGECVTLTGEVVLYESRPEIIVSDPNQVGSCD